MDVFSAERKQQVLENLFTLATDDKSNTVAAIKLYLELANGAAPDETITLEHALELLRSASPPAECGGTKGGSGSEAPSMTQEPRASGNGSSIHAGVAAEESLRSASPPAECGETKGGSAAAPAAGAPSQASPTKRTRTRKPSQS